MIQTPNPNSRPIVTGCNSTVPFWGGWAAFSATVPTLFPLCSQPCSQPKYLCFVCVPTVPTSFLKFEHGGKGVRGGDPSNLYRNPVGTVGTNLLRAGLFSAGVAL